MSSQLIQKLQRYEMLITLKCYMEIFGGVKVRKVDDPYSKLPNQETRLKLKLEARFGGSVRPDLSKGFTDYKDVLKEIDSINADVEKMVKSGVLQQKTEHQRLIDETYNAVLSILGLGRYGEQYGLPLKPRLKEDFKKDSEFMVQLKEIAAKEGTFLDTAYDAARRLSRLLEEGKVS